MAIFVVVNLTTRYSILLIEAGVDNMVRKKILLLLSLIAASIIVMNLPSGRFSTSARVYVDPPIGYANPGESFFVDMMVADVERLHSWQINISYNPTVLQYVNVTEGDFLEGMPEGTMTVPPAVDNTAGWALFLWGTRGQYIGPDGDGWLATVEFSVVTTGESVLNITDPLTKLKEFIPPPAPPPGDVIVPIPRTTEDGFFTNMAIPPHAEFSHSPSVAGVGQAVNFDASASSLS